MTQKKRGVQQRDRNNKKKPNKTSGAEEYHE